MTKKCKNFRAFPRFRDFSPKDANVIPFIKGHSNLNQTHETSPPSKERWNFVDLKTILAQKQIKPMAVDMHFFYIFWKHGIVWRKLDAAEQAWEKVHILFTRDMIEGFQRKLDVPAREGCTIWRDKMDCNLEPYSCNLHI